MWVEVSWLGEKNKHLQVRLDGTTKENDNLKKEVDILKIRLVEHEDYSRRQ